MSSSKADSRFSKQTTAMEAMEMAVSDRKKNFTDKVAIITGANSGIGKVAATALVAGGCTVVVVCRSMKKAEDAAAEIAETLKLCDKSKLIPQEMECSSLKSVEKFAQAYLEGKVVPSKQLNILINNAGIMQIPTWTASDDGYELQMAVNFLAGYHLVKMLTPLLQKSSTTSEPSRVVNISSLAHTFYRGSFKVENIPCPEDQYNPFNQYGQSKMFQVLHAQELNRTLAHGENPVIAFSLHPGIIQTALHRNSAPCSPAWWLYLFPNVALFLGIQKTLEAGAGPTIRCALDPALNDVNDIPVYFHCDCNPTKPKLPKETTAGEQLMQLADRLVRKALQ